MRLKDILFLVNPDCSVTIQHKKKLTKINSFADGKLTITKNSTSNVFETKTAECWIALIRLNEVKDNYVTKIIPCELDDKKVVLYIELKETI